MNDIGKSVRITGKVQGVSFRVWVRDEAERLGLCGWVRNEPDGSVSAFIAGPQEAITQMLDLFLSGPPGAKVANVFAEPAEVDDAAGFRIVG